MTEQDGFNKIAEYKIKLHKESRYKTTERFKRWLFGNYFDEIMNEHKKNE